MDKLSEEIYIEKGNPVFVNKVTRANILYKINELVEGYNEIRGWIDENLENYVKVLKRLADIENKVDELAERIKKLEEKDG